MPLPDPVESFLLPVLRFLVWVVWDLVLEVVLRSVGWLALRSVTLGRYPREGLLELREASGTTEAVVVVTGGVVLVVLVALIWLLWPG
jgi:hypothetical protein